MEETSQSTISNLSENNVDSQYAHLTSVKKVINCRLDRAFDAETVDLDSISDRATQKTIKLDIYGLPA